MSQIIFNGFALDVSCETSLSDVLIQLDIKGAGIALALNQCVIPKSQWNKMQLKDGDVVITFNAVAGG